MAAFDLIAFDLYGTLLDISGLLTEMRPLMGERAVELLGQWRKAQLERSWQLNQDGRYEPWDSVTLSALEEVAPDLPVKTRETLAQLWLTVPAFADAPGTLAALGVLGVRRAVLSNGTRRMIIRALQSAGLDVDCVLSADDVRAYKTNAQVYALLDAEADPSRTLFVSSNGWDVDGAKRTGRRVAWIDRGGDPTALKPEYRVTSLSEVVELLE